MRSAERVPGCMPPGLGVVGSRRHGQSKDVLCGKSSWSPLGYGNNGDHWIKIQGLGCTWIDPRMLSYDPRSSGIDCKYLKVLQPSDLDSVSGYDMDHTVRLVLKTNHLELAVSLSINDLLYNPEESITAYKLSNKNKQESFKWVLEQTQIVHEYPVPGYTLLRYEVAREQEKGAHKPSDHRIPQNKIWNQSAETSNKGVCHQHHQPNNKRKVKIAVDFPPQTNEPVHRSSVENCSGKKYWKENKRISYYIR
ncbi:hypothetical protein IEQ34_003352 [Dendrobium chrysotoxum]|uniref:Uncharacterized protein n=1 Tax=Dendrobium chrysotoxum TaxID=161865 RepID=A0AAV7HKU1_DENCH|nr:hypothetical protein IEQ34_003352 [Dendrobium chrysotoxum]